MDAYRSNLVRNIVLSGGIDDEAHAGAKTLLSMVTTEVPAHRVWTDTESLNTQEQAERTVWSCGEHQWRTLLLVASPNHMPRAFLTFVRTLIKIDLAVTIRLAPLMAPAPWWGVPEGGDTKRIDLLDVEFDKCERYGNDVATWDEGLTYLKHWSA